MRADEPSAGYARPLRGPGGAATLWRVSTRWVVSGLVVAALSACGGDDDEGSPGSGGSGGSSVAGNSARGGSGPNTGGTTASGGAPSAGKGGTSGSPGGSAGTAGFSTTGGASGRGGGGGGAATGGSTSAGSGGSSGSAGACSSAGAPSKPDGTVLSCSGEACPHGECSDIGVSSQASCAAEYPGPVNASSTFCSTTESSGGHCLRVGPITCGQTWAVNCTDGAASFELCMGENDRCTTSASFPARCQ
jgi:hypothetical protein